MIHSEMHQHNTQSVHTSKFTTKLMAPMVTANFQTGEPICRIVTKFCAIARLAKWEKLYLLDVHMRFMCACVPALQKCAHRNRRFILRLWPLHVLHVLWTLHVLCFVFEPT